MISQLISRLMILIFGTLYPAYRSYKAVKTKDVREYVKWMMYWIVFAFFTALENAADLFISWLPLYYEIKIVFLIWLLSPATKGSSILYRKFVHPWLARHEKEIDKYIASAKESSYTTLLRVGKQGLNVATDTFLKTAVTGQHTLFNTLRRYSSMQELHRTENLDAIDGRQAMPSSRITWHGDELSAQEQDDQSDYNFDDDYKVLEQQYHHQNNAGTLPGGANIPRTSSFQRTIPEAQIESDTESAPEEVIPVEDSNEDPGEDQNDDDYVPPQGPVKKKQKAANSGTTTSDARKRRSAPKSNTADVSQMRGYSTLPRSRVSKASAVPEPNYGGTLPRASRRRPKLQRSQEA